VATIGAARVDCGLRSAASGPVSAPPLAAEATPLPLQATLHEAPKQSLAALFSLFRERIDPSKEIPVDLTEDTEEVGRRLILIATFHLVPTLLT